jgi:hypothetical protein
MGMIFGKVANGGGNLAKEEGLQKSRLKFWNKIKQTTAISKISRWRF